MPDTRRNYHIHESWDARKRPRGLVVRINPDVFWRSDRKQKRRALIRNVAAWLAELRRSA